MRYYLTRVDRVTVLASIPKAVPDGALLIESINRLDQKRFPVERLVRLWNNIPEATAVKRFSSRAAALKKLWSAMGGLPLAGTRAKSKHDRMLTLLRRPTGASLAELTSPSGWQPHSVRGALSGVFRKRMGLTITSVKDGNQRVYRVAA